MLINPIEASFSITRRCNFNCSFCYVDSISSNSKEEGLSLEEWKGILERVYNLGVFRIYISGGEPFLVPNILIPLAWKIKEREIGLCISTNGSLIKKYINEMPKGVNYHISLDGPKQIHEKLRGKGTFKPVLEGIVSTLEKGGNLTIGTLVNKVNLESLVEFPRILEKIGIKDWHLMRVYPWGRAKSNWDSLRISNEEYFQLIKKLEDYKNLNIVFDSAFCPTKRVEDERVSYFFGCEAGRREIFFREDGKVIPCEMFRDWVIGDFEDVEDVWRNSKILKEFRESKIEGCINCEYYSYCKGGCRKIAYELAGNFTAKDPYCLKEYWKNEDSF